jgi:hypothetical protein
MNSKNLLLFLTLVVSPIWGKASEKKEELTSSDRHILIAGKWGGEERWKAHQERRMIEARGLGAFMGFFEIHYRLTLHGEILKGHRNSLDEQRAADMAIENKQDHLLKRISAVQSMLVKTAPSPEALELEKSVENLIKSLGEEFPNFQIETAITKSRVTQLDQTANQFFEQIKKLPILTPEQIQKEFKDLQEEPLQR